MIHKLPKIPEFDSWKSAMCGTLAGLSAGTTCYNFSLLETRREALLQEHLQRLPELTLSAYQSALEQAVQATSFPLLAFAFSSAMFTGIFASLSIYYAARHSAANHPPY